MTEPIVDLRYVHGMKYKKRKILRFKTVKGKDGKEDIVEIENKITSHSGSRQRLYTRAIYGLI